MSKVLPANRVAALAAVLSGLAGAGTSIAAAWPSAATNEIALIAGAVLTGSGTLAHIVGSIFWDRTPAGQAAGQAALEERAAKKAQAAKQPEASQAQAADPQQLEELRAQVAARQAELTQLQAQLQQAQAA